MTNFTEDLGKEKNYDNNITNKDNKQKSCVLNSKEIGTDFSYKHEVVWLNVLIFAIIHLLGLWSIFTIFFRTTLKSFIWAYATGIPTGQGITMGAHRLFAHKSFKARAPLKVLLIILQTASGQNSIYEWCRDHRLHHRYSDTDADPHNIRRGFFFSHMGWLMHKKHPLIKQMGRDIDMSDLEADWMVMWQKKYYLPLFIFIMLIRVWVPVHYFGETLWNAYLTGFIYPYFISLHSTWCINSFAHKFGTKPYDKNILPVQSLFSTIVTYGEGWHNYHHVYPWDYKAAELGSRFNITAILIRFFERIGIAYDLKTVSTKVINNRIARTGDGTHHDHSLNTKGEAYVRLQDTETCQPNIKLTTARQPTFAKTTYVISKSYYQ